MTATVGLNSHESKKAEKATTICMVTIESQGARVDGYALNVAISTDEEQAIATMSQTRLYRSWRLLAR